MKRTKVEMSDVAQKKSEAAENDVHPAPGSRKKRKVRLALLIAGPLAVLIAGGWYWMTGGRYIGTENAYVKAPIVSIAPKVSGTITQVDVGDNEPVHKGELLFRIDPAPYRIALDRAQANLDETRNAVAELKATYRQKEDEIRLEETNLVYAEKELKRQAKLAKSNVSTQIKLDDAEQAVKTSRQKLSVLKEQLSQIAARLNGDPDAPVDDLPQVRSALAAVAAAKFDLDRTEVKAPDDAIAANTPEVGDFAAAGKPMLSLVGTSKVWIEANFKETDLTYIKPGQPVHINIDTYPDAEWRGTVQSISKATESEFSLLPAQNASGNWVKVVQRIPVRIAIEKSDDLPELRAGMSTSVEIDTGTPHAMPHVIKRIAQWFGSANAVSPAYADGDKGKSGDR